jgi:hypothetical protein
LTILLGIPILLVAVPGMFMMQWLTETFPTLLSEGDAAWLSMGVVFVAWFLLFQATPPLAPTRLGPLGWSDQENCRESCP